MKNTGAYCFSIILFTVWGNALFSQQYNDGLYKTEIIQDARIDLLVKKHIQIHQTLNTMDGYRIQVFSDSGINSKNKAQSVQDEIMARFPGTGVYLTFKSPNYKVRIGDFRTKLDAQRMLIDISADYPNAFIIADQINLPKPD
ncbi:MAG: SPOR domain-containing protein [Bacteroidales bacterium]|nr:SPOR domain-containing protein [Bacteroidales bacterium]